VSVFDNASAELVECIKWYNQLKPVEQEKIRNTHIDSLIANNPPDMKQIITLFNAISSALVEVDSDKVIEKLKNLGIDSSNAPILVNKILTESPPLST